MARKAKKKLTKGTRIPKIKKHLPKRKAKQ